MGSLPALIQPLTMSQSYHPDFDANWRRANSLVSNAFRAEPPSAEEQARASALRSAVFEHVKSLTGDATLASYVADDFKFIIWAARFSINDPWINSLWVTYCGGGCPYLQT